MDLERTTEYGFSFDNVRHKFYLSLSSYLMFAFQVTNQDTSLVEPPSQSVLEPPELKGYLNKYANVAKGYSVRWFVLKNGVLSCTLCLGLVKITRFIQYRLCTDYHHQEDEQVASRGSIAMKTAVLKPTPGSGGLRFEVHSMPTRGNHGVQKWYIKANHPVEASRWVQALTKGIQWARREAERQSTESEV